MAYTCYNRWASYYFTYSSISSFCLATALLWLSSVVSSFPLLVCSFAFTWRQVMIYVNTPHCSIQWEAYLLGFSKDRISRLLCWTLCERKGSFQSQACRLVHIYHQPTKACIQNGFAQRGELFTGCRCRWNFHSSEDDVITSTSPVPSFTRKFTTNQTLKFILSTNHDISILRRWYWLIQFIHAIG